MDDFQEARAGILVFQLASSDLFLGPSCPSLFLPETQLIPYEQFLLQTDFRKLVKSILLNQFDRDSPKSLPAMLI